MVKKRSESGRERERRLKLIVEKISKGKELSCREKEYLFNWVKELVPKIPLGFDINTSFMWDLILESYIQIQRSAENFDRRKKKITPWLISLVVNTARNYKDFLERDKSLDNDFLDVGDFSGDYSFDDESFLVYREKFFNELEKILERKIPLDLKERIFNELKERFDKGFIHPTALGVRKVLMEVLEKYYPEEVFLKKKALLKLLKKLKNKGG